MPKEPQPAREDAPKAQTSFWDYIPIVKSHRALQRKLDQALAEANAEYADTQRRGKEIHEGIVARAKEVKEIRTNGMKI